jgi:hypothetical protein
MRVVACILLPLVTASLLTSLKLIAVSETVETALDIVSAVSVLAALAFFQWYGVGEMRGDQKDLSDNG